VPTDWFFLGRDFAKKLPKRLIFYRAYNIEEEDEYSPSEFYYPEDLEKSDVEIERGMSESQEVIDDFISKQKSVNTNKKTASDMKTLLRYMKTNGMTNERIERIPATELDHLLSKFFL